MITLLNIFCFASISLAILLGFRAGYVCSPRLPDFDVKDLHDMLTRPGSLTKHPPFWSWVYPLTIGLTFLEIVALIARLRWADSVGWDNAGEAWALVWLLWHSLAALLIAWFHYGIIRVYRAYAGGAHD